jgi:ribose transport system ATP-binding protein
LPTKSTPTQLDVDTRTSVLALSGVSKAFAGVQALTDVDFSCERGRIHALLGENGAGKSTLVNVASGNIASDGGELRVGGVEVGSADSHLVRELGLAVAYQDDSLIPDLTVLDNLILAVPNRPDSEGRGLHAWAVEELDRFGTAIDPDTPVRELSIASRQIVEIVKALALRPQVLILDEPTAALTSAEAERLHAILGELAASGTSIVYITHRLVEVLSLADEISVLRDGRMVASRVPAAGVDEDRLVELMVGRSLDTTFPDKAEPDEVGDLVVELSSASGAAFNDVSLKVRAGEVLGLAGVEGNGQREALRALAGLESYEGELSVRDRRVRPGSVRAARRAGVTFVSGDRRGEAVFTDLSVRDNMTMGVLGRIDSFGVVTRGGERAEMKETLETLALRTASTEHVVASLSGGNQQKIAIGRALLEQPAVYLVEEPTQGVDASTRVQIYRLLREAARSGAAVIVVSSDALEIAGLCDRVLVFSRGAVVQELSVEGLDEEAVVGASARSAVNRGAAAAARSTSRLLTFARRSDLAPVALLGLSIFVLMMLVGSARANFLSSENLTGLMFLAVPLGFAALGQAAVMLIGGIDLSIGPLISLTTVAIASIMTEGDPASTPLALAVAVGIGLTLGLLNAALVRAVKLQPLIATLATYIIVQGLALLWMPTPGGYVDPEFASAAGQLVGSIPIAFLALLAVALIGEFLYRRRVVGLAYRAVGSRPAAARRLGVRSELVYYGGYMLGGLMGAIGGIFFSATIQIGDPTLGIPFTLASVTAVVLGGMSTWGGRGSLLGPVAGAVLLAVIANGAQFMNYPPQVQYFVQGGLLIGAIALYSRLRATGKQRDETMGEA